MKGNRKIFAILFFLLLTFLVYEWGFVDNPARNILRLRPTTLNSHFNTPFPHSFTEYVRDSATMVQRARQKGGVNASSLVVYDNTPKEFLPNPAICRKNKDGKYPQGLLLFHGLLDSTYSMQWFAENFKDKCVAIYIILLPGHGTVPGDLLDVSMSDWLLAADFGMQKISAIADHIYIAGFSIGGALAIYEAIKNPEKLQGLILFAPALQLKSSLTPLIKPLDWISHFIPRLQWWSRYSDANAVKYESLPVNAIYQSKLLMDKVNQLLATHPLKIPIFVEQSADDATIDAKAVLQFFLKNTHAKSRLLWYAASGVNPYEADSRIKVIKSDLLPKRIVSMSHLSLFLPASNPTYGSRGIYRDCLHYSENSPKWDQCEMGKYNYLGEITSENLNLFLMQRITYNPFFSDFMNELTPFLSFSGT